jgi:nucleolin
MDADAAAKKERKKKKKSKKKSNQSSVAFCIVDGDGAVKEVVKKDKKRKGETDKKKEKKKKRRREADDAGAVPASAPAPAAPAAPAPKTKTADNPTGATRLFMGNLPWSITDDQLGEACGCELKAIKRITDKESGKFYGSVFVEASDAATAGAAVKRSGQDVGGRPVKIAFAPPRPGDVWPSAQIKLSRRISNHDLHAIDAMSARWRGGVVSHRSIQPARPREVTH